MSIVQQVDGRAYIQVTTSKRDLEIIETQFYVTVGFGLLNMGSVQVPPAWTTWTMWQYTDGAIGPEPHSVEGIGHCDRNKFNGDLDALRNLWIRAT